jgi:hypothetical protein
VIRQSVFDGRVVSRPSPFGYFGCWPGQRGYNGQVINAIDESLVKNAPLELTQDDADFEEWATSIPDGSISAGWQRTHPHLDAGNGMSADNEEGHALDVEKVNEEAKSSGNELSRRSRAKYLNGR